VFYRPLLDNGFSDLVNLLFPNLPDMLEIHGRFNTLMKARKRDQPAVETVGDILVAMVSIFLFFDFRSEGGKTRSAVFHSMRTTTERVTICFFIWKQFDGPNGEAFQQAAATFCKYQSVALESLRDRRKKDSKLQVLHDDVLVVPLDKFRLHITNSSVVFGDWQDNLSFYYLRRHFWLKPKAIPFVGDFS
jgi:UDP-2,3-diacylglucosamine pyrophosphatase LpxH